MIEVSLSFPATTTAPAHWHIQVKHSFLQKRVCVRTLQAAKKFLFAAQRKCTVESIQFVFGNHSSWTSLLNI
jgi:hypothetical protein